MVNLVHGVTATVQRRERAEGLFGALQLWIMAISERPMMHSVGTGSGRLVTGLGHGNQSRQVAPVRSRLSSLKGSVLSLSTAVIPGY